MYANAQVPSNYLNIRSRYNLIAGKFDSTLHIPKGVTPGLYTGGSTQSGALFYNTSDSSLYVYTGYQWRKLGEGGSTDSTIFATVYRTDTMAVNIRDEISSLPTPTLQQVLNEGSILSGDNSIIATDSYTDKLLFGNAQYFDQIGFYTRRHLSFFTANSPSQDTASIIDLYQDSVHIKPWKGGLYIDSLNSGSATDSILVWDQVTGQVKKRNASAFGGGGSPAGNFGNIQINRNGSFATPGSDSLNFSGGLAIKGTLSATALPTGGVAADSLVVVTSAGALKKRNAGNFLSGSGVDLRVGLWNGTSTLTSHQRYTYTNSNDYPSLIIGAGSGATYGASVQLRSVVGDYGSISTDGNQFGIYGLPGTKAINIYSHSGGSLLLSLSKGTTGGSATFRKTVIAIDTAVGGPSIGSIHGEYAAGDSTTSATDVGRHMFRGIGRTYANVGSFNTFYSTVSATNTGSGITQDHIVSWQSDAEKSGASTLNIIYEGAMLATQVKAGTVGKKYGWKYWDANVYAGAVLGSQMAFKTDKLKAASGLNFHFLADSSHYGQLDGNMLLGDTVVAASSRKTLHIFNGTAPTGNISGAVLYSSSGDLNVRNSSGAINKLSGNAEFSGTIKTADPGSGAGAWRLGTAVSSSGLVLNTSQYVEVSIGGTVYRLAIVDPPSPQP